MTSFPSLPSLMRLTEDAIAGFLCKIPVRQKVSLWLQMRVTNMLHNAPGPPLDSLLGPPSFHNAVHDEFLRC